MIARAVTVVLAGLVLAVGAGAPTAHADSPTATAAKTCSVKGKERELGATYVTSLSAKRVSCGKAEGVVKAFHACRYEKGKAARCTTKVKGYKCRENREAGIPTQYDSRVTCSNGKRRVTHAYTQFT